MFRIPDEKKIRVIIDTDASCEADDPFAIVHALMSPKLIVRGICAEHFVLDGSVDRITNSLMSRFLGMVIGLFGIAGIAEMILRRRCS